jgi:hypothetical protein
LNQEEEKTRRLVMTAAAMVVVVLSGFVAGRFCFEMSSANPWVEWACGWCAVLDVCSHFARSECFFFQYSPDRSNQSQIIWLMQHHSMIHKARKK